MTSMLATLHTFDPKHTPFFVYPLALAAVVQLSVSAIHAKSSDVCSEQHRDRVQVMLGVLRSLGRHWSTADTVLRKLKKIAFSVFQNPQTDSSMYTAQHGLIDSGGDTNLLSPIDSDCLFNFDIPELDHTMG